MGSTAPPVFHVILPETFRPITLADLRLPTSRVMVLAVDDKGQFSMRTRYNTELRPGMHVYLGFKPDADFQEEVHQEVWSKLCLEHISVEAQRASSVPGFVEGLAALSPKINEHLIVRKFNFEAFEINRPDLAGKSLKDSQMR